MNSVQNTSKAQRNFTDTEAQKKFTDVEIAHAFSLILATADANTIIPDEFKDIYVGELSKAYYAILAALGIEKVKNVSMASIEDLYHLLERIKSMLIDVYAMIKPRRSQIQISEKRQYILEMLLSLITFFRDDAHAKTPLKDGQISERDQMKDTLNALAKRRAHGKTYKTERERSDDIENIRPSSRFKPY